MEVTSEAEGYPVETAFSFGEGSGWRAASPGVQRIRLVFDQPQSIRCMRLKFNEPDIARTQECPAPAGLSEREKAAYEQRRALALAYLIEHSTRPQTIGCSWGDSPVGLAAWMLDHDPHSYQQLAQAFEGRPEGSLTRDQILDNITLYWVTNTGSSAARLYWENARVVYKGQVSVYKGQSLRSYGIHCLPR